MTQSGNFWTRPRISLWPILRYLPGNHFEKLGSPPKLSAGMGGKMNKIRTRCFLNANLRRYRLLRAHKATHRFQPSNQRMGNSHIGRLQHDPFSTERCCVWGTPDQHGRSFRPSVFCLQGPQSVVSVPHRQLCPRHAFLIAGHPAACSACHVSVVTQFHWTNMKYMDVSFRFHLQAQSSPVDRSLVINPSHPTDEIFAQNRRLLRHWIPLAFDSTDLRGRKWKETGEDCVIRNLIICTVH
jgi:hypothetical protein